MCEREPRVSVSRKCFQWPIQKRKPCREGEKVKGDEEDIERDCIAFEAKEIIRLVLQRSIVPPTQSFYSDLTHLEYFLSEMDDKECRDEIDSARAEVIEMIGRKFPSLEPPPHVTANAVTSLCVRTLRAVLALPCCPSWKGNEMEVCEKYFKHVTYGYLFDFPDSSVHFFSLTETLLGDEGEAFASALSACGVNERQRVFFRLHQLCFHFSEFETKTMTPEMRESFRRAYRVCVRFAIRLQKACSKGTSSQQLHRQALSLASEEGDEKIGVWVMDRREKTKFCHGFPRPVVCGTEFLRGRDNGEGALMRKHSTRLRSRSCPP
mmetsp:Transcript_27675/g.54293  ORF Transcript_27675/g.54293 Transcript_27675/m.54293 type:complete len:322 (-) Transcript_27675:53-1018(-)